MKKNYPNEKSDLSMVMLKQALDSFVAKDGFVSFITTSSWMSLSSFEKIRAYMFEHCSIDSMVDCGTELFDGKVGHNPIVAWVNRKTIFDYRMKAVRLVDYCYSRRDEKKNAFFDEKNHFIAKQDNFVRIPASPVAYWVSEAMLRCFTEGTRLGDIADSKQGLATGENDRFVRLWQEVSVKKVNFYANDKTSFVDSRCKWAPYNKGGEFRKWYGNNEFVVNWENDGIEIKSFKDSRGKLRSRPQNLDFYFRESFSWSLISSSVAAFRYKPQGQIFDIAGMSCFSKNNLCYLLALCNTNFSMKVLEIIAPTLNYQCGDIANIPVIMDENYKSEIEDITKQNIAISKTDWDSFETSWDFMSHPLVTIEKKCQKDDILMSEYCRHWEQDCESRFITLKANEEKLNRIFIDIYGLGDELTPEVADKDVTVARIYDTKEEIPDSMKGNNYVLTKEDVIKSFIFYAVGCMFGRYSLDVEGLAYAGGEWDASKYKTFLPDTDAIIPICDDEYFEDDIVGRFVQFVEVVYGKDTLEENLQFIADALGGRGTSREVIRNYFVSSFYADHVKTYKKRPIYWLFDSGKKNGFKCLIYMHRYQPDTLARIRTDYIHEQQSRYRTVIESLEQRIAAAGSSSEKVKLTKLLNARQAQAKEIREYEEKVHHLADQMIKIDLDDGVKHNYAIFKDVLAKIK